jgi:hypothetical protein
MSEKLTDTDLELQGRYDIYSDGIPGAPKRIYEHIPAYIWLKSLWK